MKFLPWLKKMDDAKIPGGWQVVIVIAIWAIVLFIIKYAGTP